MSVFLYGQTDDLGTGIYMKMSICLERGHRVLSEKVSKVLRFKVLRKQTVMFSYIFIRGLFQAFSEF